MWTRITSSLTFHVAFTPLLPSFCADLTLRSKQLFFLLLLFPWALFALVFLKAVLPPVTTWGMVPILCHCYYTDMESKLRLYWTAASMLTSSLVIHLQRADREEFLSYWIKEAVELEPRALRNPYIGRTPGTIDHRAKEWINERDKWAAEREDKERKQKEIRADRRVKGRKIRTELGTDSAPHIFSICFCFVCDHKKMGQRCGSGETQLDTRFSFQVYKENTIIYT